MAISPAHPQPSSPAPSVLVRLHIAPAHVPPSALEGGAWAGACMAHGHAHPCPGPASMETTGEAWSVN